METLRFDANRRSISRSEKQDDENKKETKSIVDHIGGFLFSDLGPSSANVKVVTNMECFFSYINDNLSDRSLVVFDIDKVLLHRVISNDRFKRIAFTSVVNAVNSLSYSTDVVCITSRDQLHVANLHSVGIDICHIANKIVLNEAQIQELEWKGVKFLDNVFYTNGKKKSISLSILYSYSKTKYSDIFFIDDKISNSQDIASFGQTNNIKVHSFLLKNTEDNSTFHFKMKFSLEKSSAFFHMDSVQNYLAVP